MKKTGLKKPGIFTKQNTVRRLIFPYRIKSLISKPMLEPDDPTDAFLGGRIMLKQPPRGYRAGLDAMLLAASLSARPHEHLLEAGCGAGAALLCAAVRLPQTFFTGLEKQGDMVHLARENSALNGLSERVHLIQGGVDEVFFQKDDLQPESFDQSFANPPFYNNKEQGKGMHQGKKRAFTLGKTDLKIWISFCLQAVKPKGRLTFIHRADRLDRVIAGLSGLAGDIRVLPIHAHAQRPAIRVLVGARKGVRSPLTLLPPLILHDDGHETYTPHAEAILRGGAALPLWL